MAALLIILLATVGLAVRAGIHGANWSLADSERAERIALVDSCARTLILVFIALLGLMALGLTYGNVLGSTGVTP
jgi:hypothetical protein